MNAISFVRLVEEHYSTFKWQSIDQICSVLPQVSVENRLTSLHAPAAVPFLA